MALFAGIDDREKENQMEEELLVKEFNAKSKEIDEMKDDLAFEIKSLDDILNELLEVRKTK